MSELRCFFDGTNTVVAANLYDATAAWSEHTGGEPEDHQEDCGDWEELQPGYRFSIWCDSTARRSPRSLKIPPDPRSPVARTPPQPRRHRGARTTLRGVPARRRVRRRTRPLVLLRSLLRFACELAERYGVDVEDELRAIR